MTHLLKKIKNSFVILAITILTTACVSGPDEKQPEAIEAANNALSSGVNNYNKSQYELASSYFKNALRDFRSIDHQHGIASSCLNLSKTHLTTGNIETAEAYLQQAQRIIQQESLVQLVDHLRIIQSSIAIENNQLEHASKILAPLLQNDINNAFTLAAIQNRTRIAHASENKDDARHWTNSFEQKIKSISGSKTHKARLARFKANLSEDAEIQNKHLSEALSIYRNKTNRPGIAATLQQWAEILIHQKQIEAAKDKLQRALYIRQSLQDRKKSLKILNSLGKISNDAVINIWIEKLKDRNFKQWDEFTSTFNRFPN